MLYIRLQTRTEYKYINVDYMRHKMLLNALQNLKKQRLMCTLLYISIEMTTIIIFQGRNSTQ